MKKYAIHTLNTDSDDDPIGKSVGVLTVDDRNRVKSFDASDKDYAGWFNEAIAFKASLGQAMVRFRSSLASRPLEDEAPVQKSVYRVTSEQTQEPTGHVLVEDGLLTGYVGENPPMGYEEGRDFTDWQNEQRGLVLEKVDDEVEQETVESQAHMVGEAVGAALVASGLIRKTDEDKRMIFGWAYITHDREGNVAVDKSGDFIDDVEEIEKTAYSFVVKSRAGDMDHTNLKSAVMVESMVFTPEKIEKMGIPPGILPTGWWVGFHFEKDEDWAIAKTRTAFSIHGRGTRKSVD